MQTIRKAIQNCAPALGLGLLSATSLALGAVALTAAPAYAQKAPKPSKEFVAAYQAALTAAQAKDYATAIAEGQKAKSLAKAPDQLYGAETILTAAYAGSGDKQNALVSLEGQIATGQIPEAELKVKEQARYQLYAELGQEAKAVEYMKAFVTKYGGDSAMFTSLGRSALNQKNYPDAITYLDKAIEANKAEGKTPSEGLYQAKLKALLDSGDTKGYLAGIEALAMQYPKPDYIKALAAAAEQAPKFDRAQHRYEVWRAWHAAGVTLTPPEYTSLAEQLMNRGMAAETETLMKPLIDSGKLGGSGDPNAAISKQLYARAQTDAKADRAGGLASSEASGAKRPAGDVLVNTGEAYLGAGDYAKAASVIQAGLTKGGLTPEQEAYAKLHLGIAQIKGGQKDVGKATLSAIKSDTGAEQLAHAWLVIGK